MREILKKSLPAAGIAALALGALCAPLYARIILVGGPAGMTREELREAAVSLAEGRATAEALEARGLKVKVSDGNVLSADLSPDWQGPTYVWGDGTVQFGAGFTSPPGTSFGNDRAPIPRAARGNSAARMPTALTSASLANGRLTVGYAVSGPGLVTVRAYGVNGKTFGRWTWQESSAGTRNRMLELRSDALRGGPVWIRWTHGQTFAVRRLSVEASR
jgi:hypothetical protein